jgi:hypothetical protein
MPFRKDRSTSGERMPVTTPPISEVKDTFVGTSLIEHKMFVWHATRVLRVLLNQSLHVQY